MHVIFWVLYVFFLGQGSSRILAGDDDSAVWWFGVVTHLSFSLFSLTRVRNTQDDVKTPADTPWAGSCPSVRCGVARTKVVWVAAAPSPWLAPHQPMEEFLHPVFFPSGISTQMGNGWAEAALGMLHRLWLHPVPSLHHDTNFQVSLKIQTKINEQSPDLPERNWGLSSEQSFRKTYFSCFPVWADRSGVVYFYSLRLITVRHRTCSLPAPSQRCFSQAGCSRLPVHHCYTPCAPCLHCPAPTLFMPQQGEDL